MHIRIDDRHLQFGPVTVDLSRQRLLALICRLTAPHARHDGEDEPHDTQSRFGTKQNH